MLNKAMLIGRLGGDPEVRFTQSGTAVCSFSIATSEAWTDKNGEKQERTEWHRITCWDKLAENVGKFLSKGRQVYVEGKLQTRKWTDKDGTDRYTTEIVARQVSFLGSRPEGENQPRNAPPPEDDPDEIPF